MSRFDDVNRFELSSFKKFIVEKALSEGTAFAMQPIRRVGHAFVADNLFAHCSVIFSVAGFSG